MTRDRRRAEALALRALRDALRDILASEGRVELVLAVGPTSPRHAAPNGPPAQA